MMIINSAHQSEGLLEIKCPKGYTLVDGVLPMHCNPQYQGLLLILGLPHVLNLDALLRENK